MRTLFWKLFISFWSVVAIFIVIAVLLLGRRDPLPETHRQAVDDNALGMYSQSLAQTYDAGGTVSSSAGERTGCPSAVRGQVRVRGGRGQRVLCPTDRNE